MDFPKARLQLYSQVRVGYLLGMWPNQVEVSEHDEPIM